MSNDDSIEVRQENEIQALKAIFNEDLRDLRSSKPWKAWKPLDIVITLSPLRGSSGLGEIHAQVDLHIICSDSYPDIEPKIFLERSRGMSDVLLTELKIQLETKALELKGEVMVFELAQHVQAFLHDHNKPGYKSFYEEMLSRQRQKQQQQQEAKQLEEDRERQVMQFEIHRRQEILRSEVKLRREHNSSSSSEPTDLTVPNCKKNTSVSDYGDDNLCEHKGTELLIFDSSVERRVQKGRCLSHSDRGCVIYSGLDLQTGDILAVTEWKVSTRDHCDINHSLKQVNSSEQEFTYLSKLRHSNLVRYLNMKYLQEKEQIIIYVLQEFVLGANCNALFIRENLPVDMDMLRYIACGVLSALDFLHRNNVVHKELRDSCIFIDNNGIIKVSGYSLEVKLWELTTQTQSTESYNKKTDIYKFGLFMLSLMKGSEIDKTGVEISPALPADLFDFLSKCLSKDEKLRQSAAELLLHPFVRTPLQRMSPKRMYKENVLPRAMSPSQHSTSDLKLFTQNRAGGPSRIQNEFEVLKWLGRGAFGDVLKVRNKLDGGYYAIKRIELNPKNKQLNRKITREVKLLSRLNHENVVRYYNSWIESAVLEPDQSSSTEQSQSMEEVAIVKHRGPKKLEVLSFGNDIELLAPPIRDVEWSVSYESKSKHNVERSTPSSSEDESSDDEDWIGFLPNHADSSDSIEFERSTTNDGQEDTISESGDHRTHTDSCTPSRGTREIQFMYIQMEFCEKSTLRTAIDSGLYSDMDRVWRLFREIVEGLAHIHQQGMIHRDLKPVNIFLDSNDHVKIGDFGLATTNIIQRLPADLTNRSALESDRELSQDGDQSMTGHIGTALYVAPELSATSKAIYNQKVDIYSLGIILFEMCYSGLTTGMERINVLSNIRLKEILYPSEFLDQKYSKQRIVISLLLNHDVSKRPTSLELLQSEHVPPPVLEECELRELVRHTLSNPQSKAYKYLVASCFGQVLNSVEDITYDMSLPATISRPLQLYDYVKQAVVKIFNLHGGQCLSTPLLMPESNYYKGIDTCVKLMTHSGSIISIPHDLRVPFARYIAWNNITLLKRYSIDRVYREKKIFGFHPRELYECAFDIVTPNPGSFMADAELLSIVSEIVNQFTDLRNKNFIIRLNHTALLKAILLHCGIPDEKHNDVYSILSDARDGKVTKFQIKTHLISLCLTDNAMVTLFSLIETESPINKASNTLRMITKRKGEAGQLAKLGLDELTKIIQNTEALGVKYNIVVALGLVYNIQQYSGMMCQFVCELKKKRRRGGLDVLAAGGRYDRMISNYRFTMERSGLATRGVSQSAVGISLSLDKLVQALQEEQSAEMGLCNLDAVVCSMGVRPMMKEKAKILRELWSAGIRCSLLEAQTLEEIQEQCTEMHVPHIVILTDSEQGVARVRSWEKDRFQEQKKSVNELTEFMQRLIKSWNEGTTDTSSVYSSASSSSYVNPVISRSESRISTSEHFGQSYTTTVIVNFVTSAAGKLAANTRKRLENQILSHLESTLQRFSAREQVIVLGLNIEAAVIKSLASYLDTESDETVQKSMNAVIEKHPRHKKYLVQICDEILDYTSGKSRPIIVVYSLPDTMFRLLL
ncbi:Gcn2 [Carabus blaptoides fortunei]